MKKLNGAGGALVLALAGMLGTVSGCGSDSNDKSGLQGGSRYAVSSTVTNLDGNQSGYVSILESIAPRDTVTLRQARPFAGPADMWAYDGSIFVSGGESPTVTKYSLSEDGKLVQQGPVLTFAAHGFKTGESAFWYNTFISPTKAYMLSGVAQYVIWNPTTMTITGKVDLPKLEQRDGMIPRAGSPDRSAIVYKGRLYQPLYWTDEAWERRPDDSQIAVFDVATDQLIKVLPAPCPGLDAATLDDSGNIYYSPWTGGAGVHLVLHNAATCVVKVATDSLTASVEFKFKDVTEGREGAVFHYAGNGRYVMSVFHHERVDVANAKKPFDIINGLDWRLWSYDPQTRKATQMQSIDWTSGALYWTQVENEAYALVPGLNYASSTVYSLGTGNDSAKRLFDVEGWATRLFKVR